MYTGAPLYDVSSLTQWYVGKSITAQHPHHNLFIRVESVGQTTTVRETGDRYRTPVTVQVKTLREGGIAENIELVREEDSTASPLVVLVTAKVLASNQGNPLLKDGVHMISHEHRDESDYTEWPGHGRDHHSDGEDEEGESMDSSR